MTRLLIVQYAGDYREADRLRRETGGEIYYGHGYVLDWMAEFRRREGEVGFLCALAPGYRETLASGAEVMGCDVNPDKDAAPVIRMIEDYDPTHLIIQGPMPALIRWALTRRMALGVIMADSFANPFYRWVRFRKLPRMLNDPRVTLVANHGTNAARALVRLGVRADRVLAWDYPHVRTPDMFAVKDGPAGPSYKLLYVGAISGKKGTGDLIRAIALLKDRLDLRLDIAGAGKVEQFRKLAARLGVADRVTFLGLVPNGEIPGRMHAADAVIVPSRHSFPEGLPLTLYEALASRTPVIASDHPMFAGHLVHDESAVVFPAAQPQALATAIERLMRDPAQYRRISEGAPAAWQRMQNPVKWGDMIERWVRGTADDRRWLTAHSVAASGTAQG